MKQAASLQHLELPMLLPGHHDQYQPDQFCADQAGLDEALRRRALRSIRSDPDRRDRLIQGKAGQS
jgi:hypothetical protein